MTTIKILKTYNFGASPEETLFANLSEDEAFEKIENLRKNETEKIVSWMEGQSYQTDSFTVSIDEE